MGIYTALQKIAKLGIDGAVDVGGGIYKSYEQIIAEVSGNVVQEGLRYSDDASTNETGLVPGIGDRCPKSNYGRG